MWLAWFGDGCNVWRARVLSWPLVGTAPLPDCLFWVCLHLQASLHGLSSPRRSKGLMRCRVLSRHGIGLAVILACSMFIAQRLGAADQWTDGDGPRISLNLDERHGDWIAMLCKAIWKSHHSSIFYCLCLFSLLLSFIFLTVYVSFFPS